MALTAQDKSYVRELVGELKAIVDGEENLEGPSRVTLFETARKLTDALENPANSSPTQWLVVYPPTFDNCFRLLNGADSLWS